MTLGVSHRAPKSIGNSAAKNAHEIMHYAKRIYWENLLRIIVTGCQCQFSTSFEYFLPAQVIKEKQFAMI